MAQRRPYPIATSLDNVRHDVERVTADLRSLYSWCRQPSTVTHRGVRLQLDPWWATPPLRQAIYEGFYEVAEYNVLAGTLKPGDRYLELGGGIGFLTTRACQLIGAESVFSYEANPQLVQVIARTAGANGFHPTVQNAVLGDTDAPVDFFIHDDFWTSSLQETLQTRRVEVPGRSFQAELEKIRPTYLMVDIEGGEIELLGNSALPDHVRAICMEVHPGAAGENATRDLLVKLMREGFSLDLAASGASVAFLSR